MRLNDEAKKRTDVLHFEIGKINIPKDNCGRLKYEDDYIKELAQSIVENGQKTAVVIRQEDCLVWLVSGSHRMRAIKYANKFLNAKIELVKCVVEEKVKNEDGKMVEPKGDDRIFGQMAENHHKVFSQLEYGNLFKRLVDDFGYKISRIAKRVGKSDPWVKGCLELVEMPEDIKSKVRDGKIKPATARAINKAPKPDRETALLESDVGKKVTQKSVANLTLDREKKTFNVDEYIKGHEREGWVLLKETGQEVDWSHKITIEQKDPLFLAVMLKKRFY
jgi:ParB/RepB/Spo0J family partition protein